MGIYIAIFLLLYLGAYLVLEFSILLGSYLIYLRVYSPVFASELDVVVIDLLVLDLEAEVIVIGFFIIGIEGKDNVIGFFIIDLEAEDNTVGFFTRLFSSILIAVLFRSSTARLFPILYFLVLL